MVRPRILRLLERGLFAVGIACLAIYGAAELQARLTQASASRALDEKTAVASAARAAGGVQLPAAPPVSPICPTTVAGGTAKPGDEIAWRSTIACMPAPDMSAWDPARRECHARASAKIEPGDALARLDIPSIKLSVIVLAGVDALCLNGGVGHIPGTPRPGEPGNVGIAGHRDGFFRGLERVKAGDILRLATPTATYEYRVEWIKIVQPRDVEVLAGAGADAITLVTCYPFRYLGSAPQRYIVRATCVAAAS